MSQRIVSLVPAATEIVVALGASDQLVGISHECDHPPLVSTRPRVTRSVINRDASSSSIDDQVRDLSARRAAVFALEATLLERLEPTLILTQSLCDVCALSDGQVRTLGEFLDPAPRLLSLTGTTLDGVWHDITAVGAALVRDAEASALLATISARLRRVHDSLKRAHARRPRTVVIEWLEPLFLAGHWTPELVARGGGIDVLAIAGSHSDTIDLERIRAARPDLILFAPCGFDVKRAARESAALLQSPAWAWVKTLPCWALDGNALTSRPGPRLADAVETIAAIVAPTLFGPPAAHYAIRLA